MQLFVLSADPAESARLLCDKHVTSQVKETVQILYTALHNLSISPTAEFPLPDGDGEMLKPWEPVWPHPCIDWAGCGIKAFRWTLEHGLAIADEFERRYGRKTVSYYHLKYIEAYLPGVAEFFPTDPAGGYCWLDSLPEKVQERIKPRLCFANAPASVGFGVVAMDPEYVVAAADGYPDCVASYRQFYAHKAKDLFVMKWSRDFPPPDAIAEAFRTYYPDKPVMTERPSKREQSDTTIEDVQNYLEATSKRKKRKTVDTDATPPVTPEPNSAEGA